MAIGAMPSVPYGITFNGKVIQRSIIAMSDMENYRYSFCPVCPPSQVAFTVQPDLQLW